MNIPTSRDLLHPMLQVAREHPRVSEGELHHFLAFEFGLYEGGPAVGGPGDLRRFACRVRVARRALLRHGLLVSGGGDALILTPQGEAYLTTGWLRSEPAVAESAAAVGDDGATAAEEPAVDLKALLDEAQFESVDLGSGRFSVPFSAGLRTWLVDVYATKEWFSLHTHVMRLPKGAPARAVVLDLMAGLNFRVPLAKFSVRRRDAVMLELEYRTEHVDAEVLGNLIRMLVQIGEAEYPGLARVLASDPKLRRWMRHSRGRRDGAGGCLAVLLAGRWVEDRLTFTPHALVRYLERYVDATSVRDLRRAGLSDAEALAAMRPRFGGELAEFTARFERVYDSRSCQCRNVTSGLSYRLHLGHVRIVVCCGVCITTLPAERPAPVIRKRDT